MERLLLACSFFVIILTSPAAASDLRLGIGAGSFNALDKMDIFASSATIEGSPIPFVWSLRPTLQLISIEGGGLYLGVGILKEFYIRTNWSWGVSFSAGAAHDTNESSALAYELEFYSRIFLSRKIDQSNALRLEFGHISNGGLHETSPGTEPLLLFGIHNF